MKSTRYPYLLMLPSVILMVLLYGYPILLVIWQSFNEVALLTGELNFIGLDNYIRAFAELNLGDTLMLTFKYTIIAVIFKIAFGFIFAIFLNSKIYFQKPLRFLQLVPWAIPQVAIATIWQWILNADYGYLNYYLIELGLLSEPIAWLSEPNTAFYMCAFVDAWAGASAVCSMFLSAFQGIDTSLYEAAAMDGAGRIRQFIDITLPGIGRVFITILILLTIWTFNSFNVIFTLTKGGPMRATETLMIRIYREAFSNFDLGMSAALSVVASIILIFLISLYLKYSDIMEGSDG